MSNRLVHEGGGLQPAARSAGLKPCGYCFSSAFVWFLLQAPLLACPVCFQIDDGHTAAGVRAAVWVLMGVTCVVLGGFAVFVRRLVRRS